MAKYKNIQELATAFKEDKLINWVLMVDNDCTHLRWIGNSPPFDTDEYNEFEDDKHMEGKSLWDGSEVYKKEISEVLKKEEVSSTEDITLLKIAAGAFLQKVTLSEIDDKCLFNLNTVPCDREHSSCDECELEKCDYF